MCLSLFTVTVYAATKEERAAQNLYSLGLFNGVGNKEDGTPIFDLNRGLTRHEAVTMLVRLLGKEDQAKSGTWSTPFTDVAIWAAPYVGYAYANGLTTGTGATTFSGERNASGAIFMDYRIKDGFDGTLSVIYGHNMKDGSMFADLNRYLEDDYLDAHPEITVLTADGETRTYHVFAARKTDVRDTLYTLHDAKAEVMNEYMDSLFAPKGANRYIALSTCTDGEDDERLLVIGSLGG